MGKYSSRLVKPSMPKRNTVNPYMRGIGCLLMIIVPAFSYGVGDWLAGQGFGASVLPPEWYGAIVFPAWLSNVSGLNAVLQFLGRIPHLPATLAIAIVTMIIVGGLMSVIFGWMYSLFAPSQYGPMDLPPPRVKTKKYKR